MTTVNGKIFIVSVFKKVGEQTVEADNPSEAVKRAVDGFKLMDPDSEFTGEIKAEYGRVR